MTQKLQQLKLYIKSLELGYSDLFLAIGFLFSVPFYALSWKFMVTFNPDDVFFKPWMMIVCFTVTVICWGFYFYFEIKNRRLKNNIVTWLFLFFASFSIITVVVQPSHSIISVVCRNATPLSQQYFPNVQTGDVVQIVTDISPTHRMFFAMASLLITTIFFIVFVLLPKRIKHMEFLILIALVVFGFLFILTLYSYITEYQKYANFTKALFNGDIEGVYNNAVYGFVVHRVPYGACMMMGVMFGLVIHSITKKWYWYIPIFYCFINMIFSWCKTSIALTIFGIFIYFVYQLIATINKNKMRNSCILFSLGFIALFCITVSLISVISKGAIFPSLYKIISSFTNTRTIGTRVFIWENIKQRLSGGWWLIGRGFGTHNYMLYPMNLLNGDDVCPSHSSFYATIGAGGIVFLLGLVLLLCYYFYVFIKCFKFNRIQTTGLSLPVFIYFVYSFTESVNYLLLVFMFPLILFFNLKKSSTYNV